MIDLEGLNAHAASAASATPKEPGKSSGNCFSRLLEKLVLEPRKPVVTGLANPVHQRPVRAASAQGAGKNVLIVKISLGPVVAAINAVKCWSGVTVAHAGTSPNRSDCFAPSPERHGAGRWEHAIVVRERRATSVHHGMP